MIKLVYYQYFLVLLLIVAVLMDFKYDRIFNGWIIFGILIGLSFRFRENGVYGVCGAGILMLLSFCIFYPIYKIGGIGAGDVKLFIMVGSFVSADFLLHVFLVSFLFGAMFSIGKMISEENFWERLQYFFSYLTDVFYTRQWKFYGEEFIQDYEKRQSNKIHFALPICISVMLGLGGLF